MYWNQIEKSVLRSFDLRMIYPAKSGRMMEQHTVIHTVSHGWSPRNPKRRLPRQDPRNG